MLASKKVGAVVTGAHSRHNRHLKAVTSLPMLTCCYLFPINRLPRAGSTVSERFFSEQPIDANEPVVLAGTEAHHLLHVMRLGIGEQVTLFDGQGDEFKAEIKSTTRREVTLHVLEQQAIDRESVIEITMGIALPKGDRQKMLIEKLTEIGVARLVPLMTERGASTGKGAPLKGNALEKLRRGVVEASKQCRRNRLMLIDEPIQLNEFITPQTSVDSVNRLFAHPAGQSWNQTVAKSADSDVRSYQIAIGPEGGFSESEYQDACDAGWTCVSLGERILRIETAAIGMAFQIIHSANG